MSNRLTRLHEDNQGRPLEVDFDPLRHQWIRHEGIFEEFTLEACYVAAEEVLVDYSNPLLKEALLGEIRQKFGMGADDLSIESHTLTLIQHGGEQGIFLARVNVRVGSKTMEVPLVFGVSRRRAVNEMVEADHEGITRMRQLEAEAQGGDSALTFPRHYGGFHSNVGPYVWVSEFCGGYREVNIKFSGTALADFSGDTTERRVVLNGLNQAGKTYTYDVSRSNLLLTDIAAHQLRIAAQCGFVLSPSFRGGDYMMNSKKKQPLKLQCYRDPDHSDNGVWGKAVDFLKTDTEADRRLLKVALQLLELATVSEKNLFPTAEGTMDPQPYFTYSILNLRDAMSRLREGGRVLSPNEWTLVFETIQQQELPSWISKIPAMEEVRKEVLRTRVRFLQAALDIPK